MWGARGARREAGRIWMIEAGPVRDGHLGSVPGRRPGRGRPAQREGAGPSIARDAISQSRAAAASSRAAAEGSASR